MAARKPFLLRIDPETHEATDAWAYSYDNSNHAVTGIFSSKIGSERFDMHYDAVGNMIYQRDDEKNRTKSIEYDSFNRIRKVSGSETRSCSQLNSAVGTS